MLRFSLVKAILIAPPFRRGFFQPGGPERGPAMTAAEAQLDALRARVAALLNL